MDLEREVCHCVGVTVGDIKKAIDDGARSFEEVQEVTQASTVCGQCEDEVRTIISDFVK